MVVIELVPANCSILSSLMSIGLRLNSVCVLVVVVFCFRRSLSSFHGGAFNISHESFYFNESHLNECIKQVVVSVCQHYNALYTLDRNALGIVQLAKKISLYQCLKLKKRMKPTTKKRRRKTKHTNKFNKNAMHNS